MEPPTHTAVPTSLACPAAVPGRTDSIFSAAAITKVSAGSVLVSAHATVGLVDFSPTKYNTWFSVALQLQPRHVPIETIRWMSD
jgi:hypothetical protein